jgi:hypothetical protein
MPMKILILTNNSLPAGIEPVTLPIKQDESLYAKWMTMAWRSSCVYTRFFFVYTQLGVMEG